MRAICSASRTDSSASSTSAAEYLVPARELFAKDSLLKEIRRHSAQFSRTGEISVRTHNKLHMPESSSRLGKARKLRLLKSAGVLPCAVDRYIKDGTHANILKQVNGSLPGMASAFRCYTAFCELRRVPLLPSICRNHSSSEQPLQRHIDLWGLYFPAGALLLSPQATHYMEDPHASPMWLAAWGNVRIVAFDSRISPGPLSSCESLSMTHLVSNLHILLSPRSYSRLEYPRRLSPSGEPTLRKLSRPSPPA